MNKIKITWFSFPMGSVSPDSVEVTIHPIVVGDLRYIIKDDKKLIVNSTFLTIRFYITDEMKVHKNILYNIVLDKVYSCYPPDLHEYIDFDKEEFLKIIK